MAGGTVALVIGMFLCCYIVEKSTTENTWAINEPERDRVGVAWLQKGGKVNDQHFKSYILRRTQKHSKLWATMPALIKAWLFSDMRYLIRTSHQDSAEKRVPLSVFAVMITLAGFVSQFVGLRGLAWQVTIAQLVATVIMTGLRAVIRRNLVHEPECDRIEGGYELEEMAMKIHDCIGWNVTAWTPGLGKDQIAVESYPSSSASAGGSNDFAREHRLVLNVMNARQRLGTLAAWNSECQKTAVAVVRAIEFTMDFLWATPDIKAKTPRLYKEFQWGCSLKDQPLKNILICLRN
jgi:hypothetical protein